MKHLGPLNTMLLVLAVGVLLLTVTATEYERRSVDLLRPTTLLSFVASRLHAVQRAVRGIRVSDHVDAATKGFRETIRKHEGPKKSLE